MAKKHVLLVVDDDELNRDMLSRRLRRAGYDVVAVADGQACLDTLAATPIDLVLLDIMMPGMSGLEVLARLRAQPATAKLPVILVTAKAASEHVVEGLEQGADDYVTKPIDLAVALARVRTQLARHQAEQALTDSEERYALAVLGTNDGVWDWRLAQDTVYYSPRWAAIMGYEEVPAPVLNSWLDRLHPDDADRVRAELDDHLRGETPHLEIEHRIRRGDAYRWVLVRGLAVRDDQGQPVRLAGSVTDITEGKVADALTGLPNRVLFFDRLGRLFEHARRAPGFQFAVLFLDLDRFKTVNDSMGHAAGDSLLVETAHRLEANLRSGDSVVRMEPGSGVHGKLAGHTVARFGGDEFAIILSGIHHPSDATRVADRLSQAITERYGIDGREVFISASIGIALSASGYERPEDMLRDADTALYRAKAAGRGRCELFDEAMRAEVVQRMQVETDLRYAVERNEFVLHYQPIVNLQSGKVTGQEALIRWNHPTRGLLLPADFVPIAEETGLIVPLGLWVIGEASRQLAVWAGRGADTTPVVSINLSARQLAMPDFAERACGIVDAAGVARSLFEFEITETVMMGDPEANRSALSSLKAAGFRLSIDDFGTGYSSLSYLQRFPVDRLKLDRSFLNEVATNTEVQGIMQSVVLLAEHLKLEVVAEGIETYGQLEKVRSLNCTFGQGYYFSRPVPPDRGPL
jgi:PAS domain S-box-containing protein